MTHEELETMVRLHQAELYRYLRYLGADRGAACEDLVQETFLAAFRSADGPRSSDVQQQAAWLRGIARNLFLMHCRRRSSSPVQADSESVARAEAVWTGEFLRGGDGFETIEALRACVGQLGERPRRMLDLFYGERKSRAEMAALFEMTEDGIKTVLRRIRGSLAECIRRRLEADSAARG